MNKNVIIKSNIRIPHKIKQLSNYFCVIEKYVLDKPVRFSQCWVLCLRDKLLFPRRCIEEFLSFYTYLWRG